MSFFEIKNISCIRGNKLLFKNLNFKLKNQELLVIKGANGSGKTTLLKILSGLLKPLSGSIIFDKKNINTSKDEYLKLFEYIGHENAIKNALTVRENLNFYLKIKKNLKKENFKNAIKIFNLKHLLDIKIENLSSGEKRRVSLSRLILSNSKIWFLDEPTNSLDKKNTLIFFKILNQHLKSNGIAVIASHDEINIKNKNIDLTIN
ncbi:MAG: Cytochrome c biogenesis ATP-binding export protein CcmA [Alphaproteobacteria bacterium MarineAlpha6_Bin6]|nr:heme ABC transporter ATP-binding protein [Pelagibacteraceae bacterium]PPR30411.1 MAG: Cytochrome c biogenesis ATP-binding export protein CcmA [Alphaproteobacteria bacterium MarineAlpha6_Bin6]PPR33905.1 MAG: Cytochrome c biogenesis ATP-binding export protein CcmA [Alphaproteobacteria bacterium MarineAlpha6_Bin5]|tara:strand:- start:1280 stop:1894 length:615 start_codon:yes stop_codon:yes gene_type:complete